MKAPARAFSFKPSFLNAIIRKEISNETFETISASTNNPITELINRFAKYKGWTLQELKQKFDYVNPLSKNALASFVSAMVGLKDLAKTEEFIKANIILKTVRIEADDSIEQDMSFGNIDFFDVACKPWEESKWCSYFEGASLFLCIFKNRSGENIKGKEGKNYTFEGVKIYHLPDEVTGGFIRFTYEDTAEKLNTGNIVREVKETSGNKIRLRHMTNFVGKFRNPICHIRPKGQNFEKSQRLLPRPDNLTGNKTHLSQCIWLDKRFIQSIIEDRAEEYINNARATMEKNGDRLPED